MSKYIEDLEEQNEYLRRMLIDSERRENHWKNKVKRKYTLTSYFKEDTSFVNSGTSEVTHEFKTIRDIATHDLIRYSEDHGGVTYYCSHFYLRRVVGSQYPWLLFAECNSSDRWKLYFCVDLHNELNNNLYGAIQVKAHGDPTSTFSSFDFMQAAIYRYVNRKNDELY